MKPGRFAILPLVLTAVLAANISVARAQQKQVFVALNLDANPPGELSEWISGKANAILTLYGVGIDANIKVDVTLTIWKEEKEVATIPKTVTVRPGVNIFSWRELTPSGNDAAPKYHQDYVSYVVATNRLPSGDYSCCVSVDAGSSITVVNRDSCRSFHIRTLEPPRLRFPKSNSRIYLNERPRFEWLPVNAFGEIVYYRFVLSKVNRDQGQTPTNAFRGNRPICDMIVPSTMLFWPSTVPLPDTGLYVWSVQEVDAENNPAAGPDGWADLFVFSVIEWGTGAGLSGRVTSGGSPDNPDKIVAPPDMLFGTDATGSGGPVPSGGGAQAPDINEANQLLLPKSSFPAPELENEEVEGEIDQIPFLFRNTTAEGERRLLPRPGILQVQNIVMDPTLLKVGLARAEFFDDTITIVIARTRQLKTAMVWIGSVEGDKESAVIFVAKKEGDTAIGNIYRGDALYQVRYFGNNVHKLIRIDQSVFSTEADPLPALQEGPPFLGDDYSNTDPPDRIDLMVLYTEEAEREAGGRPWIELDIALAVAETNVTYENSGIGHQLELVHTAEVSYTESGKLHDDLAWVRENNHVRLLRDHHAADIVMLIVEKSEKNMVGLGGIMPYLHPYSERFAFGVVQREASTVKHTFGHEIGHIMGCLHECGSDPDETPLFPYAHGYRNAKEGWGTIMATLKNNSFRLPLYSNPALNYKGQPTGRMDAECSACEACVMEKTAPIVANYRRRLPQAANLLIKDTWSDRGMEPDSLGVGQYLWSAPLLEIVRDTGLSFDPRRPIPEPGKARWVNTTVQNGGADTAFGELNLYYREASLSAEWDSSWTLFSSTPGTVPPGAIKTFRAAWTDVPGPGQYSVVARWESATDTMYAPETENLYDNALNNNNIAWKNAYVLELIPPTEIDLVKLNAGSAVAQVTFRGIEGSTIEVICAKSTMTKQTFVEQSQGTLQVGFDPESGALFGNEGELSGIKRLDALNFRVTGNEGGRFRLTGGDGRTGRMTITFRPGFASTQAKYPVHIVHKGPDGKIIGGVSYLLIYPEDSEQKREVYAIEPDSAAMLAKRAAQVKEGGDEAAASTLPSTRAITLLGEIYRGWGDVPRRPSDAVVGRALLNPTLRFGDRFSLPPMIAFTTQSSNAVIPTPQVWEMSPLQFLMSPANTFGLSPRFGIVGIDIGSHTPELSGLIGSSVQLFGLGVGLAPGNFRVALSGGVSQAAATFQNDSAAEAYTRWMVVGGLGWEKGGAKIGLNVLYAADDPGSATAHRDSVLYRTFAETISPATTTPLLVTVRWSPPYQPGDHVLVNDVLYTVQNQHTLTTGNGSTGAQRTLTFQSETTLPSSNRSLPDPQQNLVVSINGRAQLNDAISIEGEIGGSLFTSNTNLEGVREEISASVREILPISISSSLDYAGRFKVHINKENDKLWNLEVGAEYIMPGYRSLGLPYLAADRFSVTVVPNAELLDGDLWLSGAFGWRKNNLTGMELSTETEKSAAADLSWRVAPSLRIGAGYAGFVSDVPVQPYLGSPLSGILGVDVRSVNHALRLTPSYQLSTDIGEQNFYGVAALSWGKERVDSGIDYSAIIARQTELSLTGFYLFSIPGIVSADASLTYMKRLTRPDSVLPDAGTPTPELIATQSGTVGLELPFFYGRLIPRLHATFSRHAFLHNNTDVGGDIQIIIRGRIGWKVTRGIELAGWVEMNDYDYAAENAAKDAFTEIKVGLEMKWKL